MNSTPPYRRRSSLRLLPFCLLGLAVFGLLLPLFASPQLPVIRFVRDPDPAPDFQLKDLAGKDLSLASVHGKVILLNFWATWCGPCRAEIPSLIELQNRYKDRLQIIGLADDDDPDVVKQVIDSEGINFPVAIVTDKIRFAYGGISALPTVFRHQQPTAASFRSTSGCSIPPFTKPKSAPSWTCPLPPRSKPSWTPAKSS